MMSGSAILYPEDKIPFRRLLPMGMQHVVAMFGATVLAPGSTRVRWISPGPLQRRK